MLTALPLHSLAASFFLVRGIERHKVLRMSPTTVRPIFEREKSE